MRRKLRPCRPEFESAEVAEAAYFSKDTVGKWLDAAAANPEPIMALYDWTLKHPHPVATGGCPPDQPAKDACTRDGLETFRSAVLPQTTRQQNDFVTSNSAWSLPAPAVCLRKLLHPKCSTGQTDPSQCPGEVTLPANACPGEVKSLGPPDMWRVSLRSCADTVSTMALSHCRWGPKIGPKRDQLLLQQTESRDSEAGAKGRRRGLDHTDDARSSGLELAIVMGLQIRATDTRND